MGPRFGELLVAADSPSACLDARFRCQQTRHMTSSDSPAGAAKASDETHAVHRSGFGALGPVWRLGGAFVLVAVLLGSAALANELTPAPAQATIKGLHHVGRPLRVLVVGDSLAGTLEVGLARAAPAAHVQLAQAAQGGCSVAIAWNQAWASTVATPSPPTYPCQSRAQLSSYWLAALKQDRPDVVIYASHMDTIDQDVSPGSDETISVADPAFAAQLTEAIEEAVDVLSSTGAKVILANSAPTLTNLVGNQNDAPANLAAYLGVIDEAAARSGGRAIVFDLARALGGPGNPPSFTLSSPSGVQWRCSDGIHISPNGGVLVAPSLFKLAWSVSEHRLSTVPTPPPLPPTALDQPWPPFATERQILGCPPS